MTTPKTFSHHLWKLRIRVECAFGIMVQKWALLRKALPKGLSIKKIIALVNAVAKLHNFCIDRKGSTVDDLATIDSSAVDTFHIMNSETGFVALDQIGDDVIPTQLLGGGAHFEDVPRERRRNRATVGENLPRKLLHDHVLNSHKVRPVKNFRK